MFYAVKDGKEAWRFETGKGIFSSPCLGPDGIVYVGSNNGKLYAMREGKEVLEYETGAGIGSFPCLGPDGTVYIGSKDRKLYAFKHPEIALTRVVEEAGKKSADTRPDVNEDEQWLIIDGIKLEKQRERRGR